MQKTEEKHCRQFFCVQEKIRGTLESQHAFLLLKIPIAEATPNLWMPCRLTSQICGEMWAGFE